MKDAGGVTSGMDLGYIRLVISHAAAVHGLEVSPEPVDLARIALKRLRLVGKGRERDRRTFRRLPEGRDRPIADLSRHSPSFRSAPTSPTRGARTDAKDRLFTTVMTSFASADLNGPR
ncbi:hypothetical protein LJR225_001724 [Phenylobacterium sp. LjRoot225]|uniref:hypothetical protein n=1 Tax=Phenylobacterium sp. LjRoot225 TaxID=3342285 RepID=UPI003ECD6C06